jgi:hypothetical protein
MGRMGRLHCLLLLALSSWLVPCRAQEFVDDALRPLFHAVLLAEQVRGACAELDPTLGTGIDSGLEHLRARRAAEVAAGRAAAERRVGPDGLERLAATLGRRFGERLQRQDEAGRRVECATLATWLETTSTRSRQSLVGESFHKWFARQQQARQIHCERLDGTARALARRLLSGPEQPDLLRADARMAERAAGWCQQVQDTAGREGIRVPGDFARIRVTAHVIADAALPLLSGRDPTAARRLGREAARRYLAEPDWI